MGTPLSVETVENDGSVVQILVTGELDISTAGQLEAALHAAGTADLRVDLAGLTFIDSSGIRVLVLEHQRLREAGHRMTLCNCSSVCQRTFEVAGLADELDFETQGSPDAAL